jgi:hypothetical protein
MRNFLGLKSSFNVIIKEKKQFNSIYDAYNFGNNLVNREEWNELFS